MQETWMQVLPAKSKRLGRHSWGLKIKESKWGTSCKSMWIKHPWNTGHIPYSDLAKTLFPVENRNNVKIKITHHRVIGEGCIWEGMSLNTCWLSQSVLYQIFCAVNSGAIVMWCTWHLEHKIWDKRAKIQANTICN